MWARAMRRGARPAAWPARALHASAPVRRTPLQALRAGFSARDLEQVWDAWDALRTGGALHQLRRHDEADLLALVRANLAVLAPRSASAAHTFPIRDTRDPAWRERCAVWGRRAAERKDVLGVHGWMRVELLCGDAPRAIALFRTYLDARRAAADGDTLYLDADVRQRRQVHDLLEVLVLAYAHTGDVRSLVDTFQSFDVGTHTELFFDYAHCRRQFAKFPWNGARTEAAPDSPLAAVQERALAFVSHAELARGLQRGTGGAGGPNRIARLLGSLLTRGDVVSFWRLFRTAMAAGVLPADTPANAAWLAQAQLAQGDALPAWTDSCWTVCLSGLLAARRTDLASQVWAALIEVAHALAAQGVAWPPLAVWNALLDGYSRANDFDAVQATWQVLVDPHASTRAVPLAQGAARTLPRPASLAPDLLCYTTMIAASFRRQRPDLALALFRTLQEMQARGELAISVETYNAVLHGLCVVGRTKDAQHLFRTMGTGRVPRPTITTLNVLLRAQSRSRDLSAMAETLRAIPALQLRPDVITFTTVLDALLRVADTPERARAAVEQVMQIMHSMDVQPNSVTFTAMIKACLHIPSQDGEPRWQVALQLLHTMCTTRLAPNGVTYATIIPSVLAHGAQIAALAQRNQIPALFRKLPSTLPQAHAASDLAWDADRAALRLAIVLWEQMRADNITPSAELYHAMLRALLAVPENATAFAYGAGLADELLHAHGALAPHATAQDTTAPTPTAHSWITVLSALAPTQRHAAGAASALADALLSATLQHYVTSPHGRAALRADPRPTAQRVERLVRDARTRRTPSVHAGAD
ncbi:hypothetical protein CBS9595_001742 [Malassezia furfur]|nr:hypothetical protein CBS9595_001742 [Malassezia furfur]